MPMTNENGRTLAGVAAELKDELKDFATTRIEMMKSEMRDKLRAWKMAVPLIAIGLLLALTAWFVLTAALIAIIAVPFLPSPFAYFFAFIIVGVVYLLGGTICAIFAYREMKEQGVMPERTIKVLKDDRVWLQTEARSQV